VLATTPLVIPAYAKLNLALGVGPPAPPRGYHPIASWFVAIDLADQITLRRLEPDEPSRHHVFWDDSAIVKSTIDWPIEKDLAVRAHRLLEMQVGRKLPLELELRKHIPVGGGLGGGSSDAAAVLVGVNILFELKLPASLLRTLAEQLGSDVAFFVDERRLVIGRQGEPPRAAMVSGFGERLARVPTIPQTALLFFPPFGCPTGAVYKAFDAHPAGSADAGRVYELIKASTQRQTIDSSSLFNDLAAPASRAEPRLAQTIADLARTLGPDILIHVTGSGSTLFALVSPDMAPGLRDQCVKARPDVGVAIAQLVGPKND
jgi:4-diphosphocytidyl-2-C-methyl-D-erythritol kinase